MKTTIKRFFLKKRKRVWMKDNRDENIRSIARNCGKSPLMPFFTSLSTGKLFIIAFFYLKSKLMARTF